MRTLKQKEIEKKEKIKEWYEAGVPISTIASRLGNEIPAVYYHLRSMGIYRSREQKEKEVRSPRPERTITYNPMDIEELDYSLLPDSFLFMWRDFKSF